MRVVMTQGFIGSVGVLVTGDTAQASDIVVGLKPYL
jgi:hypothetical protein